MFSSRLSLQKHDISSLNKILMCFSARVEFLLILTHSSLHSQRLTDWLVRLLSILFIINFIDLSVRYQVVVMLSLVLFFCPCFMCPGSIDESRLGECLTTQEGFLLPSLDALPNNFVPWPGLTHVRAPDDPAAAAAAAPRRRCTTPAHFIMCYISEINMWFFFRCFLVFFSMIDIVS